jgi:hypothetical protein
LRGDAKDLGPRLDGPTAGGRIGAVQAHHASREVPHRDLEKSGAEAEELADDAGAYGGHEHADLARSVAGQRLQSGLDPTGVPVETLALGLNQLGQDGPDVVVHTGLILVSVRVRSGAAAKMVSC